MKIVIIGGGIAGLAFGIIMQKKGNEVIINERFNCLPKGGGNAFMLHSGGFAILDRLCNGGDFCIPGNLIDTFILKRPDEREISYTKMEPWQCVKRNDLITFLCRLLVDNSVKFERIFSHFIYDNGKAVAAVFENGHIEYGDMFVGADGGNSRVRETLFGKTNFSKVEVQEILGIANNPELVQKHKAIFTKYQSSDEGISFGFIPFSDTELIWYSQFDVSLATKNLPVAKNLSLFTKEILRGFPPEVHSLLDSTDFNDSYLWNTKDFDPLPRFHYENIVLIGDAAHLALPFTSAGTSDALFDAEQLATCLGEENDIDIAFTNFYKKRIHHITEHLELGRNLKKCFLNPRDVSDDNIEIPLIKQPVIKIEPVPEDKLIKIIYFTDPICSTCWTIQPQLRKLKLEYGRNIQFRYVMGGLLPSWNNFNRGGIQQPSDVAAHWSQVSIESGMPIDSTVWIHDPLDSSYPPSIAFKAAQLQDVDKAILFLRRINEIVFLQRGNITKSEVIKNAAYESGLDAARLLRDLEIKAKELFCEDLNFTRKMGINILPSFIFMVNGEIKEFLSGAQTYETFEQTILKLYPGIRKKNVHTCHTKVFTEYPSLTKPEFKFLTNTDDDEADLILGDLLNCGKIKECKTHIGFSLFTNFEQINLS